MYLTCGVSFVVVALSKVWSAQSPESGAALSDELPTFSFSPLGYITHVSASPGCEYSDSWSLLSRPRKSRGRTVKKSAQPRQRNNCDFKPLSPSIKLQFLLLCFHSFLTEVVGRSC